LFGLIAVTSILWNYDIDTFIKATAQTTGRREIEKTRSPPRSGPTMKSPNSNLHTCMLGVKEGKLWVPTGTIVIENITRKVARVDSSNKEQYHRPRHEIL
jgi:hypothetical protein